eukprot:Skav207945  [mRNA]  locus=scaffold108:301000:302661:+ [translate_table: standard]
MANGPQELGCVLLVDWPEESMPAKQIADVKWEDQRESLPKPGTLPGCVGPMVGSALNGATSRSPSAATAVPLSPGVSPALLSPTEAVTRYLQHLPQWLDHNSAFVEEHLGYLTFEDDHLLAVLRMFLRYHHPESLAKLEALEPDANLDWIAQHLGDDVSPLRFLLGRHLEDSAQGMACVSQLCSFMLEVSTSSQESQVSYQNNLGGALTVRMFFVLLATLKSSLSTAKSAAALWEDGAQMRQATPRSSWCLLSGPDWRAVALQRGICQVAPDEVLQHIYERPAVDWRLVVLDVRSASAALGLPVCVRAKDMDLSALPRDPAIHLCVVGDDVGQCMEMCQQLCAMGMCHISLVDGGWEALEQLVLALGLELLPPSPAPAAPSPAPSVSESSAWRDTLRAPAWALAWAEPPGRQWQDEELMDL